MVGALAALAAGWVLLNLALQAAGCQRRIRRALQGSTAQPRSCRSSSCSRRDEELAQLHQELTLQLALLGEQKGAKLIALVEALRKDHPAIPDRHDAEAQAMAQPANPEAVLDAINAKHD